jgi:SOS-response transcriptional repressor LexA
MNIERQKRTVLAFIRDYQLVHGFAPSIREIAKAMGQKSPQGAHRIVMALQVDGKVRTHPGRKRSIELMPTSAVLSIELPSYLYEEVQCLADKANVTLAAVVIEAVRDGLYRRSKNGTKSVPRETSRVA